MSGRAYRWPARAYRWPAEWEPHRATWLSWPHNPETWPGRLDRAEAAFCAIVRALEGRETVCINVTDAALEDRVRRLLGSAGVAVGDAVELHRIPTDDAWVRDHGPIFVVRDEAGRRERLLLDFVFDAWGRKYPPWDRDDDVPRRIADALGLPRRRVDVVLEGGSIDGNGAGTILTTESCLLHPNRGAGRTRAMLEKVLGETLGAAHVVWLGGAVAGDDTDGHVDDLARFVGPRTVVAAVEERPGDENSAPLARNFELLRASTDQDGRRLEVVALPMPPPLVVDGQRCPASYANFYLANGVALVPVFGAPEDERALAILRELLPGREVVGIPSADLVAGFGAVHCLTQQEPAETP
jgi:agmatine deiminase